MIDYVTYAIRADLQKYLTENGMVDEGGSPDIALPKIPVHYYGDEDIEVTISVVRCMEKEDSDLIEALDHAGALLILGTVVNGAYEFKEYHFKELYERTRKVGRYREMVPTFDENGNVILDENGNTVKEPTTHTYIQGVFA